MCTAILRMDYRGTGEKMRQHKKSVSSNPGKGKIWTRMVPEEMEKVLDLVKSVRLADGSNGCCVCAINSKFLT